jgi:hypothetical protein
MDVLTAAGGAVDATYDDQLVGHIPEDQLTTLNQLANQAGFSFGQRDDYNLIGLAGAIVDSRLGISAALPGITLEPKDPPGVPGLHILQFIGPIKDAWLQAVESVGLHKLQYIPYNAIVVTGTPEQLAAASSLPFVQFADKLFAPLKATDLPRAALGAIPAEVLLPDIPAAASTVERLSSFSLTPPMDQRIGGDIRLQITITSDGIDAILHEPLVLGLFAVPTLAFSDERIAMLTTNNVASGAPLNPKGYTKWLTDACAFCGRLRADGYFVGIADSGMDGGNVSGSTYHHVDVPYAKLAFGKNVANPSGDLVLDDTLGHGTLVAGLAAGEPSASGSTGLGGFFLGTGIAPSAGLFITKMNLASTTQFSDINLVAADARNHSAPTVYVQNHSYNAYALLSTRQPGEAGCNSNVWSGCPADADHVFFDGAYSPMSVKFDSAVLDSKTTDEVTTPITLTVSAGNKDEQINTHCNSLNYCYSYADGNWKLTLPPATAKNVIAMGMAENSRPFNGEFCNGTGTDSRNNIALTSKRGTVFTSWYKPDLFAPATFAISTKSTASSGSFCAISTPSDYKAGSGTSFAAPLAAGAAVIANRVFGESRSPNCGTSLIKSTSTCDQSLASPALLKAMLVLSAQSMRGGLDRADDWTLSPTSVVIGPYPNALQGFGRLDLTDLLAPGLAHYYQNDSDIAAVSVASGAPSKTLTVQDRSLPVKIVLAWSDPPGAAYPTITPLVNNLVLTAGYTTDTCKRFLGNKIAAPNSTRGEESIEYNCTDDLAALTDKYNNVQVVRFFPPSGAGAFTFTVNVHHDSGTSAQTFALAVSNAYDSTAAPPPIPATFTSTATSSTGVSLGWSGVSAGNSVTIARSENGLDYDVLANVSSTPASYADSGLDPAKSYSYRIRAVNGPNGSAWLNATSTLPSIVSFASTATTLTTAQLVWSGTGGAFGFDLERKPVGGTFSVVASSPVSPQSDSSLTSGATYVYRVRAKNPLGVSGWSYDASTLVVFSHDPIVVGDIVLESDISQIRTAINQFRANVGLSAASFTDTPLVAGTTVIKVPHVMQLRSALDAARGAASVPALNYTDLTITVATTTVKAAHIQELREGIK